VEVAPVDIPVCDLRDADDPTDHAVCEWEHAAAELGCFALVNHGIDDEVRDACVAAARQFHTRSRAWKDRYAMAHSVGNKGYLPDDYRPNGDGTKRVVRDYAALDIGPELSSDPAALRSILLGPNRWPDLPGFRPAVEAYHDAVRACAEKASTMFSRICGLPPDHLVERSRNGCSLLRLLHYPRPAWDPGEEPNGHTDYEWFTLIWQSSPGLEILGRDGVVRVVADAPGTLVVVLGDLLEVLSGGRLESTLHWVRPRRPDRYSLTYFHGPDFDETVAPATGVPDADRYPGLHAGEHLTALRVRHLGHLRRAVTDGTLTLPFELPATNPLKQAKVRRLATGSGRSR
jgi:isopenicillin N synthase-like dioxygenase